MLPPDAFCEQRAADRGKEGKKREREGKGRRDRKERNERGVDQFEQGRRLAKAVPG